MANQAPAKSSYQFRLRPEVKRTMARLNLSQNKLARLIGISSGFMSQILTGTRCVGPDTRQKLMEHLPSLAFDQLFQEVNSSDPGASG